MMTPKAAGLLQPSRLALTWQLRVRRGPPAPPACRPAGARRWLPRRARRLTAVRVLRRRRPRGEAVRSMRRDLCPGSASGSLRPEGPAEPASKQRQNSSSGHHCAECAARGRTSHKSASSQRRVTRSGPTPRGDGGAPASSLRAWHATRHAGQGSRQRCSPQRARNARTFSRSAAARRPAWTRSSAAPACWRCRRCNPRRGHARPLTLPRRASRRRLTAPPTAAARQPPAQGALQPAQTPRTRGRLADKACRDAHEVRRSEPPRNLSEVRQRR